MHVITEAEYENAVAQVSEQVFAPITDDDDVREWSLGLLDDIEDADSGEMEEIKEDLRERTWKTAMHEHPWTEHETSIGIDTLPVHMSGFILEHSDRSWRTRRFEDRLDEKGSHHERAAQRGAALAFAADVHAHVTDRIRSSIGDDDE